MCILSEVDLLLYNIFEEEAGSHSTMILAKPIAPMSTHAHKHALTIPGDTLKVLELCA